MELNASGICFIIDSPINALVASLIAKNTDNIYLIFALDPEKKNIKEFLHVCRALMDESSVVSEDVIEIDSVEFWSGDRNRQILLAGRVLESLVTKYPLETVYFGNCFTNPVTLAMKRFFKVNHLYHAPSDFHYLVAPQKNSLKKIIKKFAQLALDWRRNNIDFGDFPIFSLLNFYDKKEFQYLDFNCFSSGLVESSLAELSRHLDSPEDNIMLLLAGDEPEPGDYNPLNIAKYLEPHYLGVERLMKEEGLGCATLWIKEHKSYLPLNSSERALLMQEFAKLRCGVRFVADYLPAQYRSLPGECILRYGRVDYVIGEPSSFLLNIAGSDATPIAIVTDFSPYRDDEQLARNDGFLMVNRYLKDPFRVF